MKTNKIIVRALVVLGFGGAVGLASGCSASRASKSRKTESTRPARDYPAGDSIVVRPIDGTIRVMYGVPPARFDRQTHTPEGRSARYKDPKVKDRIME